MWHCVFSRVWGVVGQCLCMLRVCAERFVLCRWGKMGVKAVDGDKRSALNRKKESQPCSLLHTPLPMAWLLQSGFSHVWHADHHMDILTTRRWWIQVLQAYLYASHCWNIYPTGVLFYVMFKFMETHNIWYESNVHILCLVWTTYLYVHIYFSRQIQNMF